MDRKFSLPVQFSESVNRISDDIENSSANLRSCRYFNRMECTDSLHSSCQTIRRVHRHCSDGILANMLLNFHDQFFAILSFDGQCIMDFRKVVLFFRLRQVEMHIYDRSDNLRYMSYNVWHITLFYKSYQWAELELVFLSADRVSYGFPKSDVG